MTTHPLWTDEYWLLLMQLYLNKPVGMKPPFSRTMVKLALELHIPPQFLHEQMFRLRMKSSPMLASLWDKYGENRRRLNHDVKRLRQMKGFGSADDFYKGVQMVETFETDFQPIKGCRDLKPVSLIMILDTYFRLTPNTMVVQTPEIRELAKLLAVTPKLVVEVMQLFQCLDPSLNRPEPAPSALLAACQKAWDLYGWIPEERNNLEKLSAYAAQLRDFFI